VNTLKISVHDLKKRLEKEWILTPVPWCKEGFWIEHRGNEAGEKRRDIGNLIEHALGYIYIQEPASMIPPIVLDPCPGEVVLDMCASPGSKSTQIAQYMKNSGVLISNDAQGVRMSPLALNLQKVGATNVLVTFMDGKRFAHSGMMFDKILVDAPCSGVGTIRKSIKTVTIWNPAMIRKISGTQKQLIETAYGLLKSGGTLVYSTCSLEPDENEGVVDYLLSNHSDMYVDDIEINMKRGEPVVEFEGRAYNHQVKKSLRIWPQDNDTEGFFVCKFKKK
jgi:NOL1/NOP2/sun family putative RNA methylase